MSPVFHNRELERLHAADDYARAQVDTISAALEAHGTLRLTHLPTGLYPATSASHPGASAYRHVWVRDNVFVALALWRGGELEAAAAVARGLLAFYGSHRRRFAVTMDSPETRPVRSSARQARKPATTVPMLDADTLRVSSQWPLSSSSQ